MSLQPQGLEPIPEATSRLAHKSSPKGTAIMRLRDALGPIYQDEAFASLFPRRARPAEAPWRLALVTVFQALENLSDRQAAQMVALRAGVEATISQGVRTQGLRQARYRGQEKVHVHHLRIAAAINLVRIDRWLQAHEQGRPARRSRALSRFGQLQHQKV